MPRSSPLCWKALKADAVELNFSTCQGHTVELARLLTAYYDGKGYDRTALVGSIDFDPMQKILTKGKDTTALLNKLAELVNILAPFPKNALHLYQCRHALQRRRLYLSGTGLRPGMGNKYLNLMVEAGIPAALAAKKIKFNFGISGVYFMEIAKFRAARMMWAQIVKQYNPVCPREDCTNTGEDKSCNCACKMYVNATTSTYNMTVFDSYVNMLRTQTEAMSAALANVDAIVVTPFDAPYEVPTDFAERIARNQQLLLQEESHFDKIVDVAGGSYFIETLTRSLAEGAWKLFLAVEEEGWIPRSRQGWQHQKAVNDTNAKRHANAGKRKEFLLGTNQFPNFNEKSEGKAPLAAMLLPQPRRQLRKSRSPNWKQAVWLPISRHCAYRRNKPKTAGGLHAHHRQLGHAAGTRPVQL